MPNELFTLGLSAEEIAVYAYLLFCEDRETHLCYSAFGKSGNAQAYAGMQLRLECAEIMRKQGHEEETGHAKITGGYNLPCRYVLHTVGPIVSGTLTKEHEQQLASCYRSCLDLAAENNCESLAFCCISTGEFHFPNEKAAEIAVETVKQWQARHPQQLEVIFNVFKNSDREIYEQLLG